MEKCEFISQNQNKGSCESNGRKSALEDCNSIQNSPSAMNAFLIVRPELRTALRENSRKEFCSKKRGLEDKSVEQARQLKPGRYCRLI